MSEIISKLSDVSGRYDALFCDLWGCLHNGFRPFPEAVEALRAFREKGGTVVLLTNAPRPRPSVLRQLDRIGVPRDCYDEVVSSGDASQAAMVSGLVGRKVYHLGPAKDEGFFTEMAEGLDASAIRRVPLEEAEGIVCTGLFDDQTETPEDYRATLLYARNKGMKLLCTNPDIVVDMGDKRVYCAGAIAALYTEMGGESYYFGKPHPPIYDLARRRLNAIRKVADDHILCVGDGITTDIRGGIGEGLDTLFISGGLAAEEFGDDPLNPDPEKLEAFFARHRLSPLMVIPVLR